jgi:hypothetical protein
MRRLLLACTALIALTVPSGAAIIDNFIVDGSTSALTLVAAPPPGNQPQNNPCLICGTNQPGQPTGFGYNNFDATGNQSNYAMFSTSVVGGSLASDTLGVGYSATFLRAFLISQADLTGTFSVGIDMNQTNANSPQTLESFAIINLSTNKVLAQYSLLEPGGTELPVFNNGTGYPDYLLTGFDIDRSDVGLNDNLIFFARWSGANDGPESFFLVANPTVAAVPELSTWLMMIIGFAGVGGLAMRRQGQQFRLT